MSLMMTGMILWRPHLATIPFALVVGLLVAWGYFVHRNLLTRVSRKKAFLIMIPRVIVISMLVLALLDPAYSRRVVVSSADSILMALDVSSSMDVKDTGSTTRLQRARAAVQKIKSGLPSGLSVKILEFDTEVREPATARRTGVRNTDLGAVLMSLSRRADLSSCAAMILVTDGGDEPVGNVELPGIPLSIVGVGSDLANARDLAIADVQYPPAIEKEAAFEFHVDVSARNPGAFAGQDIRQVPLTLEREENGRWKPEAEQRVDLSRGRVQADFKTMCRSSGLQAFRLTLKELPGELSGLNNSRTLTVDVRQKSLHVLFFARELGLDLKMLRGELVRDTGVTFTALFRTIGERFTIQGERVPGDEPLESGFPGDVSLLKPFDVVIIGSVPLRDWHERQMVALKTYVENGGSVVFLGDEAAFGPAGYSASQLAPLLPWDAATAGYELMRGEFAVSIPLATANHPVVTGLSELLQQSGAPTVESVLPVGPLKTGALSLMTVLVDKRSVPLVAVQRYGRGSVLALSSNTLWKWARQSEELRKVYGMFWRQAVRSLAPNVEGGRILSVKWDKDHYKPGEKAVAEVRTSIQDNAAGLTLTASLSREREAKQIPVEPLQGQSGVYTAKLVFEKRGVYRFQLAAHQGTTTIETYDKTLPVAPLLGEGAKLELDGRALATLAKLGGGMYVEEQDADKLAEAVTAAHLTRTLSSDVSLLSDSPWFALVFLAVLICEWTMRRRMNLF